MFFSRARQSNRWAALMAAAGEWVGRRGQEMVTSMAVTEGVTKHWGVSHERCE
jgi:hypothetical protein